MLRNKYFKLALMLLPLLGLVDATYLTIKHYTGEALECSLVSGCETVLTSKYAEIFGFPVAGFGVAYYAVLFLLISYFFLIENGKLWKYFKIITGLGFIATLYFVSLQLFVIKAICQYCMLSAVVTTVLLVLVVIESKTVKEIKNQ